MVTDFYHCTYRTLKIGKVWVVKGVNIVSNAIYRLPRLPPLFMSIWSVTPIKLYEKRILNGELIIVVFKPEGLARDN